MIREKLLVLRERRALLVARAEGERQVVIALVTRIERATAWFDRAKGIVRKMRANPVWVAAGVAVLVALRPRRAIKLFMTGFSMWRSWRSLRAMIERFAPPQLAARRAY